jgi:hypothetical protein
LRRVVAAAQLPTGRDGLVVVLRFLHRLTPSATTTRIGVSQVRASRPLRPRIVECTFVTIGIVSLLAVMTLQQDVGELPAAGVGEEGREPDLDRDPCRRSPIAGDVLGHPLSQRDHWLSSSWRAVMFCWNVVFRLRDRGRYR